jgi:hypothetical protein
METDKRQTAAGKQCQLLKPIPDRQGKLHFSEAPIILRELINPGGACFDPVWRWFDDVRFSLRGYFLSAGGSRLHESAILQDRRLNCRQGISF